jgi:hypothetical protein
LFIVDARMNPAFTPVGGPVSLVNLTPHVIEILDARRDWKVASLAPSGEVARVATSKVLDSVVDGIEIFATSFGEVTGLPEPREGVLLVVSALVAGHPSVRGRTDVVSPGELVRGPDGQPRGCRGLTRAG